MPIYEYQCDVCGHRLEKLQKISDSPLSDCPACKQPGLRKLVSAVAFRLKGGGWYETDFKDEKSRRNVANADEKPGASDAGKTTDSGGAKQDTGTTPADAAKVKQTKTAADGAAATTSSPAN